MTGDVSGQGVDRGLQAAAGDAVVPGDGGAAETGAGADTDADTQGAQFLQESTPEVAAQLAAARQDADSEA